MLYFELHDVFLGGLQPREMMRNSVVALQNKVGSRPNPCRIPQKRMKLEAVEESRGDKFDKKSKIGSYRRIPDLFGPGPDTCGEAKPSRQHVFLVTCTFTSKFVVFIR